LGSGDQFVQINDRGAVTFDSAQLLPRIPWLSTIAHPGCCQAVRERPPSARHAIRVLAARHAPTLLARLVRRSAHCESKTRRSANCQRPEAQIVSQLRLYATTGTFTAPPSWELSGPPDLLLPRSASSPPPWPCRFRSSWLARAPKTLSRRSIIAGRRMPVLGERGCGLVYCGPRRSTAL